MPGFNCLFIKDGIIAVGGVEGALAIRTYFDRELDLWAAVVRSGQEYGGERALAPTRKAAVRQLRDGIAVVEDYRKRADEKAQKMKADAARRNSKKSKKPIDPVVLIAMVAALAPPEPLRIEFPPKDEEKP